MKFIERELGSGVRLKALPNGEPRRPWGTLPHGPCLACSDFLRPPIFSAPRGMDEKFLCWCKPRAPFAGHAKYGHACCDVGARCYYVSGASGSLHRGSRTSKYIAVTLVWTLFASTVRVYVHLPPSRTWPRAVPLRVVHTYVIAWQSSPAARECISLVQSCCHLVFVLSGHLSTPVNRSTNCSVCHPSLRAVLVVYNIINIICKESEEHLTVYLCDS